MLRKNIPLKECTLSEKEIIEKVKKEDSTTYKSLYYDRESYTYNKHQIFKIWKLSDSVGSEVYNDGFVNFISKIRKGIFKETYQENGKTIAARWRPYLHTLVKGKWKNNYRKEQNRKEISQPDLLEYNLSTEPIGDKDLDRVHYFKWIRKELGEDGLNIIKLKLKGYSNTEIAKELGVDRTTITYRLSRFKNSPLGKLIESILRS